ncbi:MAG: anti-sigma factor antagonist [Nitrospirales bacterium]|nr:MAG: anti-sigma factor antagonist [Nitrospirales bacterium]
MNRVSSQPPHFSNMHIITLGACLDAQAEHLLESAVYQAQEAHGQHILLDLQALTMIDSRGLGKLFLTYHHLNRQNIRLSMVNPRPMVREMLEFVNFPKLVQIYDSLDEIVGQEQDVLEASNLHSSALK